MNKISLALVNAAALGLIGCGGGGSSGSTADSAYGLSTATADSKASAGFQPLGLLSGLRLLIPPEC